MKHVSDAQRRARLGRRHLLATRGEGVDAAARAVVALHATDPATVYLAAAARADVTPADVERALYDDRSLVRLLSMRRTLFALPVALASVAFAACTRALVPKMREGLVKNLAGSEEVDGPVLPWLAEVERKTIEAVRRAGEATGAELSEAVPELKVSFEGAPGKPYNQKIRLTTRVLDLLAARGAIVRGRPTGSMTSTRYAWEPLDRWLPAGLDEVPEAQARAALVAAWLDAFGPGTVEDVAWWTGFTKGQVKAALGAAKAVEVGLSDGTGYVLPGDEDDEEAPPWAALLPALDPTPMGWKGRGFFGGALGSRLYDSSGNICPTVWWDGRIVGGWAQRASDGRIRLDIEDVGQEGKVAIDEAAHRIAAFLGDVVVRPRFPTPMDKGLSAG